jgi:tRNA isopentenyl-2-thiomethyl-A-37 hydroxylase MiaE
LRAFRAIVRSRLELAESVSACPRALRTVTDRHEPQRLGSTVEVTARLEALAARQRIAAALAPLIEGHRDAELMPQC